jgi:multidrug resistance efflux pump
LSWLRTAPSLKEEEKQMQTIDERLAAIEAKLKQLKVQQQQLKVLQQRKDARARKVEGQRTRREELRRKFLVGAVVLAKVEDGSLEEAVLKAWLHPAITKPEDRVLFGLDTQ